MKLLIITHSYHPNINARSFRWTAICENWVRLGHEVHVITAPLQGVEKTLIKPGLTIHRPGGRLFESLRGWVNQNKTTDSLSHIRAGVKQKARILNFPKWVAAIKRLLKCIHDVTWKKVYWPDASFLWIWPSWQYSRKLCRSEQFDAVITVSHPFSGHVIGLLLKQSFPAISWLADSGDPFCYMEESAPNNFKLYRRLNHRIEKKILQSVDHFTVTTNGTAFIYQQLFSESAKKICVIPPLLQDAFLCEKKNTKNFFEKNAIILFFAGTFYDDIRNPRPLLVLLDRMVTHSPLLRDKLQMHIFGSPEILNKALDDYPTLFPRVHCHDKVPHNYIVNAMQQATCLVNIGNKTSYQLPSKIIEYMSTGKPILNICTITDDSSSNILVNYPFHMNILVGQYDDLDSIVEFIEQSPNHGLSKTESYKHVMFFSSHSISDSYLKLIEKQ